MSGPTLPGWPTLKYEICFNQDPNDPSPPAAVWTDVTAFVVRGWTSKRGRQYELAQHEAGTLDLTLANDGRFDPTNTASPYYPYVVPYRQIRVSGFTIATGLRYIFTGYVERWPQTWSYGGNYGVVAITCVDVLAAFAQISLLSALSASVLGYRPLGYWPLTDATGSLTGVNLVSTGQPLSTTGTGGGVAFGTTLPDVLGAGASAGSSGTVGSSTGLMLTPSSFTNGTSFIAAVPAGTTAHVCGGLVVRGVGPSQFGADLVTLTYAGVGPIAWGSQVLHVGVNPTGYPYLSDGNGLSVVTSSVPVTSGSSHVIVWDFTNVSGTLTLTITVDGTVTTATLSGVAATAYDTIWVGGLNRIISGTSFARLIPQTVAHVSLGTTAPVAMWPLAITGAPESSGARVNRILAAIPYNGTYVYVDPGSTAMAPAGDFQGSTALAALQSVEATENGRVYVSKVGALTFNGRGRAYNRTSTFTFGEQEIPYAPDINFDFDPTYLYGTIMVGVPGSTMIVRQDPTSTLRYFPRSLSVTSKTVGPAEASAEADYLLSRYKDPHLRVAGLTLTPSVTAGAFTAVLSMEIGDLVTVKRRPPGAPAITLLCFVESIAHTVAIGSGGASWTTALTLSPADTTPYFVLDSASLGLLDSSTVVIPY